MQLNEDPVKQWLEKIDTDYMICAHTHYPGEMTYKNKHYFNSGSVGISIDDAGYAQCMLLESGVENGTTIWKPQFLKVPYDNQKVAQDMITGGHSTVVCEQQHSDNPYRNRLFSQNG